MKKIKLKSKDGKEHEISLYDSVEQLPAKRYTSFNKWSLLAAGIGSNVSDFDRHHSRLDMFIQADRKEQAIQEFYQLRQAFYLAINEINPKQLSFACMVAEIDGQEYNDLSQDGLQTVLNILNEYDLSNQELEQTLADIKKK